MKGSIIKRGASYSVVVELDRDPVTGKRRREWHSGYLTKRDAETARVEILGRMQRGEQLAPSKLTLDAYLLEVWLPAIAASVRSSTLARYRLDVNTLERELGSVPLQGLTGQHLDGLYARAAD